MDTCGRVAVAVDPRLLGAALARTLRRNNLEVVELTDAPPAARQVDKRPFDVALTSGSLPADVVADVVITLSDPSGRTGSIQRGRPPRCESVTVGDLPGLLELVERFCTDEAGIEC